MPKPSAILNLEKGEKFYKFFFFRPQAGRHVQFEYRVFTKLKADGKLEMAAYNFKVVDGRPHKGEVLTSSEVPPEELMDIINNVKRSTNTLPHEFEEIDLSRFATVQEQVDYLKARGRVDVSYLH
jgi:hypothetical protein